MALALVGSVGIQGEAPQPEMSAQMQAGESQAFPGQAGREQRRGGPGDFEHGSRGASLFGAGEMLKDLIIIALIVAVVAPITRLLGRRGRRSESALA